MRPSSITLTSVVLFAALLGCTRDARAVRIAIVSLGDDAASDLVALSEAKLSKVATIQLVERAAINAALSEQSLAASGLMDASHAIALGKVVRADLLATVDVTESVGGRLRSIIVFDSASGVRLCDVALVAPGSEANADAIVDAVRDSAAKHVAAGHAKTICLLTVRNADLAPSDAGVPDAIGVLLERALIRSPQIAMLERERLVQITRERALTGAGNALIPSIVTLEMDLAHDGTVGGEDVEATASLYDLKRQLIDQVKVKGRKSAAAALAEAIAKKLIEKLSVAKPSPQTAAGDADGVRLEAARFSREATFRLSYHDMREAVVAADAAHALNPSEPHYQLQLATALIGYGRAVAKDAENPGGFSLNAGKYPDLGPALKILKRASEEMAVGGDQPGGPSELAPAAKVWEDFFFALHQDWRGSLRKQVGGEPFNPEYFRFTDQQIVDLKEVCEAYRTYMHKYEEPAFRAAVKDPQSFLVYTALIIRLLGDECHLFAHNSNEFTSQVAQYVPIWAKMAGCVGSA